MEDEVESSRGKMGGKGAFALRDEVVVFLDGDFLNELVEGVAARAGAGIEIAANEWR